MEVRIYDLPIRYRYLNCIEQLIRVSYAERCCTVFMIGWLWYLIISPESLCFFSPGLFSKLCILGMGRKVWCRRVTRRKRRKEIETLPSLGSSVLILTPQLFGDRLPSLALCSSHGDAMVEFLAKKPDFAHVHTLANSHPHVEVDFYLISYLLVKMSL